MEASLQELVSAYWRQELFKRFATPGAEEPTKRKEKQMACSTCGHTMVLLSLEPRTFWCSRCGSIMQGTLSDGDKTQAPRLVDRCREYEKTLSAVRANNRFTWYESGIAESIHIPEERPAASKEPT